MKKRWNGALRWFIGNRRWRAGARRELAIHPDVADRYGIQWSVVVWSSCRHTSIKPAVASEWHWNHNLSSSINREKILICSLGGVSQQVFITRHQSSFYGIIPGAPFYPDSKRTFYTSNRHDFHPTYHHHGSRIDKRIMKGLIVVSPST